MDDTLIISIWDIFKEYISEKNKEVAATQFVEFLVDQDTDQDIIDLLLGYDPHLDEAIKVVCKDNDLDVDEDFDDSPYGDIDTDFDD